jgi:hypothetical protein
VVQDLVEVMTGSTDDVRWAVLVGREPDGGVLSMVRRQRGSAKATSGMGGPALYPRQLVNSWTGQATGLPPLVPVRAAPSVAGVPVALESGARVDLPLSDVVAEFGLRFGATPLPEQDRLVGLVVTTSSDP